MILFDTMSNPFYQNSFTEMVTYNILAKAVVIMLL